jgi:hypothetical protein
VKIHVLCFRSKPEDGADPDLETQHCIYYINVNRSVQKVSTINEYIIDAYTRGDPKITGIIF